jgi:EmrB/QacA subfamily drug resistance transporter
MTIIVSQETDRAASIRPTSVLALVVLATMLSNLEVGLVNVALPTLAARFQVGPTTIQWVALAYQLAIVGTLVLFGRLVDLLGGRPLYLTGMATVAIASVLAALSQSVLWLILARGLLGLGAAMLLATGQALLAIAYSEQGRGRALGIMHMAVAGGLMAGPSIGGLLITTIGWRAMFLAPLPLALGAFWWAWNMLPTLDQRSREPLDLVGAVLVFATAACAVFGLTRLAQDDQAAAIIPLLLALVAGLLFVMVERRQAAPLVDLGLLTQWSLSAGLLAALLTFIALASNMFLIPFALQDLMGHSAAVAGLVMMIVPVVILPIAPLAGVLADRFGSRLPTMTGLVAITVAITGMAQFRATTSLAFAGTVLALYGLGAGLFQAPNNSAVLGAAPVGRTGIVSGMLALARNLGQVLGVAVASAVWSWQHIQYQQQAYVPPDRALAAGLRDAFLVLAGFGLLALVVTALRKEAKGVTNDA